MTVSVDDMLATMGQLNSSKGDKRKYTRKYLNHFLNPPSLEGKIGFLTSSGEFRVGSEQEDNMDIQYVRSGDYSSNVGTPTTSLLGEVSANTVSIPGGFMTISNSASTTTFTIYKVNKDGVHRVCDLTDSYIPAGNASDISYSYDYYRPVVLNDGVSFVLVRGSVIRNTNSNVNAAYACYSAFKFSPSGSTYTITRVVSPIYSWTRSYATSGTVANTGTYYMYSRSVSNTARNGVILMYKDRYYDSSWKYAWRTVVITVNLATGSASATLSPTIAGAVVSSAEDSSDPRVILSKNSAECDFSLFPESVSVCNGKTIMLNPVANDDVRLVTSSSPSMATLLTNVKWEGLVIDKSVPAMLIVDNKSSFPFNIMAIYSRKVGAYYNLYARKCRVMADGVYDFTVGTEVLIKEDSSVSYFCSNFPGFGGFPVSTTGVSIVPLYYAEYQGLMRHWFYGCLAVDMSGDNVKFRIINGSLEGRYSSCCGFSLSEGNSHYIEFRRFRDEYLAYSKIEPNSDIIASRRIPLNSTFYLDKSPCYRHKNVMLVGCSNEGNDGKVLCNILDTGSIIDNLSDLKVGSSYSLKPDGTLQENVLTIGRFGTNDYTDEFGVAISNTSLIVTRGGEWNDRKNIKG